MARVKHNNNKLSNQQEQFVSELVKGSSQRQAYIKAYPNAKTWKETSVDCNASILFSEQKVKQRYDELLAEVRKNEQGKTMWTREQSITELRYVIDKNKQDIERIEQASEDELIALLEQIKENPQQAQNLATLALLKKQKRRISGVHNGGIVSAVAELNKMQGFNEETINLNGTVVFEGEADLED